MSDSVGSHRRQPTRLCCPWDSPGKNTGVGCHFLLQCMKVKSESEVAQSCPTLSNPMDCSLLGSSVHGIFQARVLEWGAIAFSVAVRLNIHQLPMLGSLRSLTQNVLELSGTMSPPRFMKKAGTVGSSPGGRRKSVTASRLSCMCSSFYSRGSGWGTAAGITWWVPG